jgi:hypothetical protein
MAELLATITRPVHTVIGLLYNQLHDEVYFHYYLRGKGKPGSPARALRWYGFKNKAKKKLLKEVNFYLKNVEVIEVPSAYTRDIRELTQ